MTFAIGIQSRAGLVALADTRIVRGGEKLTRGKLAVLRHGAGSFFVMTSGLRSVRDKLMIYTEEALAEDPASVTRLHEVVTLLGRQLQWIREEDGAGLAASGLAFNLHAVVGGRLDGDDTPQLMQLYPAGNWIVASDESPTFIIGRSGYGRPLVDRVIAPDTPLRACVALAVLAFDATRTSAVDADFPVDLLTVTPDGAVREQRLDRDALTPLTRAWRQHLRDGLHRLPQAWSARLLPDGDPTSRHT